MATAEQVKDYVQAALAEQSNIFRSELASRDAELQALRTQLGTAASTEAETGPSMLKTQTWADKVLKRVDEKFKDGTDKVNFSRWKWFFEIIIQDANPQALTMLNDAEVRTTEIDPANIPSGMEMMNTTIYYILVSLTGGEAQEICRNVPENNGVESWRQICKRFSPKTPGKKVHHLKLCINPGRTKKLTDIPMAIAKWESQVRFLASEFNENLSDGIKVGILLNMVPDDITKTLTQILANDDLEYQKVKDKILMYVQNHRDFDDRYAPMEVDNMMVTREKEETLEVEQEEKDLNVMQFRGRCHICKKEGHRACECPETDCWNCGQKGHRDRGAKVEQAEVDGEDTEAKEELGELDGKDTVAKEVRAEEMVEDTKDMGKQEKVSTEEKGEKVEREAEFSRARGALKVGEMGGARSLENAKPHREVVDCSVWR